MSVVKYLVYVSKEKCCLRSRFKFRAKSGAGGWGGKNLVQLIKASSIGIEATLYLSEGIDHRMML